MRSRTSATASPSTSASECRGIFLDRGELERLVDAEQRLARGPSSRRRLGSRVISSRRTALRQQQGGHYGQKPYKKKKSSFLEELFD